MLQHDDIWRGIDLLAARHGLSVSALARKAGLDPTSFNKSKRMAAGRARWPSTESIARILQVTQTSFDDFVGLATSRPAPRASLRFITFSDAAQAEAFDASGHPAGALWDDIPFPALTDSHAFAVEVDGTDLEPLYRAGDRLILSPAEKPRRGDRVLLRTTSGEIRAGSLVRESPQKIELTAAATPAKITLPKSTVLWMHRIIWASQ